MKRLGLLSILFVALNSSAQVYIAQRDSFIKELFCGIDFKQSVKKTIADLRHNNNFADPPETTNVLALYYGISTSKTRQLSTFSDYHELEITFGTGSSYVNHPSKYISYKIIFTQINYHFSNDQMRDFNYEWIIKTFSTFPVNFNEQKNQQGLSLKFFYTENESFLDKKLIAKLKKGGFNDLYTKFQLLKLDKEIRLVFEKIQLKI